MRVLANTSFAGAVCVDDKEKSMALVAWALAHLAQSDKIAEYLLVDMNLVPPGMLRRARETSVPEGGFLTMCLMGIWDGIQWCACCKSLAVSPRCSTPALPSLRT